jgi:hypothetical protein
MVACGKNNSLKKTIQQFNNSTIQQFNNSTIQQFNNSTIPFLPDKPSSNPAKP